MILGVIFAITIVFLIVRRFVHHDILKKHHDIAGFVIGVLGVLYGVLLSFTIISSQNQVVQIVTQVDEEAYLIADLYRIVQVFPEKPKSEMIRTLWNYLKSVIDEE